MLITLRGFELRVRYLVTDEQPQALASLVSAMNSAAPEEPALGDAG
jgi:hypothetical protein